MMSPEAMDWTATTPNFHFNYLPPTIIQRTIPSLYMIIVSDPQDFTLPPNLGIQKTTSIRMSSGT